MNAPSINTTPQNALQRVSGDLTGTAVKRGTKWGGHNAQRRSTWKGKKLPQYPNDGRYYRRPSTNQIANALSNPNPEHWVNIWLTRLAILDPSRYAALRSAFADKGKAGLSACGYESKRPCPKCGGTHRFAVYAQCSSCNKETRYGKEPKASESELIKREQKKQAKASAEAATVEAAGWLDGWTFICAGCRTLVKHPELTSGKPQALTETLILEHHTDAQFAALYQWACNSASIPDGAEYKRQ